MSSGWGCQYLSTHDGCDDWCVLLKHKCEAGCKGCVMAKTGIFNTTKPNIEEDRVPRNRSDNPLAKKR